MAYTGKFISSKEVIAKLARTFRPTGSSWINEAIEDIGWAMQAIGHHGGFENKQTEPPYLSVQHNRAKIPCDVERIIAVEQLFPTEYPAGNILNPDGTTPYPQPSVYDDTCNYRGIRMRLGTDLTGYGLAQDNPRTTDVQPDAPYYNLNSDYVITSFTEGLIKLHYIGFSIDKDGYPKIIDDADYKMALEWYLFSNMLLKGYKHHEIDYKTAFQMWEMYRLRAENIIKLNSLDSAERFRSTWTRFATGSHYADDFFMNSEQPQYISRS
jgi:hypothetical protein